MKLANIISAIVFALIVFFGLIAVTLTSPETEKPKEAVEHGIYPPRENPEIMDHFKEAHSKPEPQKSEKDLYLNRSEAEENSDEKQALEMQEPETQGLWTDEDVEILACAIYSEAGGNAACDETRYMVGDVILNRIADERWPDTMEEVLTQKQQYGEFYWTGIKWPERAEYEPEAVQRAYEAARALLSGERHSVIYGQGYVWQAEFPQGTDPIYADGLYFGK